ncbi:MAG: YciI family protein [Actinophytocola sp.]|uniref:YciI family protein n=1 Tax=Actinophytocola sp. TaxID=1872138 RepID=UPI003C77AC2B
MALFLLTYGYHETDLRAQRRDDHVAYLNTLRDGGSLVAAGPYEDGSGGAILLDAEDHAAAENLVAGDPFTQLDVTKDRYLRAWKVTVGGVTG